MLSFKFNYGNPCQYFVCLASHIYHQWIIKVDFSDLPFSAFACIFCVGYSSLGHEVYAPTLDWHLCSPEGCVAISVLVIACLNAPLVFTSSNSVRMTELLPWFSPAVHEASQSQLFTRHHNRRSTFVPCSEHCTSAAYELISGYCSNSKDLSSGHQSLVPTTLHLDFSPRAHQLCILDSVAAYLLQQRCHTDLSHWSHPEISITIWLLAILSTTIWHPAISCF